MRRPDLTEPQLKYHLEPLLSTAPPLARRLIAELRIDDPTSPFRQLAKGSRISRESLITGTQRFIDERLHLHL